MIQKILPVSAVPSPLTRGHWVVTLECGHLHSITLLEPLATEALIGWAKAFVLPKGEARAAVIQWFNSGGLWQLEADCHTCDLPTDWWDKHPLNMRNWPDA